MIPMTKYERQHENLENRFWYFGEDFILHRLFGWYPHMCDHEYKTEDCGTDLGHRITNTYCIHCGHIPN